MIGQITKGSNFGRLISYLTKADKDAEILDTSAFTNDPEKIASTFEQTCARNPLVSRTVTHVSLAFASEDGVIDRDTKIRVGEKVIEALGYGNSHYLMVSHGRSDPGHRHGHDHDHIHIALTSVDLDGQWVKDSWNFRVLETALRQIEKEEGFRQVKSSWEAKRSAPTRGQKQRLDRERAEGKDVVLPVSDRLQTAISESAEESVSVSEMAHKLAHRGIEAQLNITRTGKVRGISYQMDGVKFQGNQLYDASWPKLQNVHGLRASSEDISRIKMGYGFLRDQPMSAEPKNKNVEPHALPASAPEVDAPQESSKNNKKRDHRKKKQNRAKKRGLQM